MAQPFSDARMQEIRARLIESARHHALETGYRHTTLDMLTADAGIAKSSFYKFFPSKEILFLDVGSLWERQILARAAGEIARQPELSSKERVALVLMTSFRAIHEMGLIRFLREDLPLLLEACPQEEARQHYLSSSELIFEMLCQSGIRFRAPDEIIRSMIHLLYLSMLGIGNIGDSFFPAMRELVLSACERMVI